MIKKKTKEKEINTHCVRRERKKEKKLSLKNVLKKMQRFDVLGVEHQTLYIYTKCVAVSRLSLARVH